MKAFSRISISLFKLQQPQFQSVACILRWPWPTGEPVWIWGSGPQVSVEGSPSRHSPLLRGESFPHHEVLFKPIWWARCTIRSLTLQFGGRWWQRGQVRDSLYGFIIVDEKQAQLLPAPAQNLRSFSFLFLLFPSLLLFPSVSLVF